MLISISSLSPSEFSKKIKSSATFFPELSNKPNSIITSTSSLSLLFATSTSTSISSSNSQLLSSPCPSFVQSMLLIDKLPLSVSPELQNVFLIWYVVAAFWFVASALTDTVFKPNLILPKLVRTLWTTWDCEADKENDWGLKTTPKRGEVVSVILIDRAVFPVFITVKVAFCPKLIGVEGAVIVKFEDGWTIVRVIGKIAWVTTDPLLPLILMKPLIVPLRPNGMNMFEDTWIVWPEPIEFVFGRLIVPEGIDTDHVRLEVDEPELIRLKLIGVLCPAIIFWFIDVGLNVNVCALTRVRDITAKATNANNEANFVKFILCCNLAS